MESHRKTKFFLVDSAVLPEIIIKVSAAKELLETGEVSTVADAVGRVGISRSAFYKYKDAITPFKNMKIGNIITFHMVLRDKMGVLSSVLAIFSGTGANILTINQSIPANGAAFVTISVETGSMVIPTEELMAKLREAQGVIKIEALAG